MTTPNFAHFFDTGRPLETAHSPLSFSSPSSLDLSSLLDTPRRPATSQTLYFLRPQLHLPSTTQWVLASRERLWAS